MAAPSPADDSPTSVLGRLLGRDYITDAEVPLLVAAVEAVLTLADEWITEAKRIDGIFATDEDPWPRTVGGMRAEAFESCAKKVREAITSALAGKEARDAR